MSAEKWSGYTGGREGHRFDFLGYVGGLDGYEEIKIDLGDRECRFGSQIFGDIYNNADTISEVRTAIDFYGQSEQSGAPVVDFDVLVPDSGHTAYFGFEKKVNGAILLGPIGEQVSPKGIWLISAALVRGSIPIALFTDITYGVDHTDPKWAYHPTSDRSDMRSLPGLMSLMALCPPHNGKITLARPSFYTSPAAQPAKISGRASPVPVFATRK